MRFHSCRCVDFRACHIYKKFGCPMTNRYLPSMSRHPPPYGLCNSAACAGRISCDPCWPIIGRNGKSKRQSAECQAQRRHGPLQQGCAPRLSSNRLPSRGTPATRHYYDITELRDMPGHQVQLSASWKKIDIISKSLSTNRQKKAAQQQRRGLRAGRAATQYCRSGQLK